MSLPQRNSDALRANLAALDAWMESPSFVGWCAARDEEVKQFNDQIAYDAASWEDVVRIRAMRENTVVLAKSFEETRETLKTLLDEAVENETKIATESRT